MAMTNRTTVAGVFRDSEEARDAINALKDAGFQSSDIGLLMRDRDEARDMAEEMGTHAGEGAATGAVTGGILGGLAGWLVGIGALAIPGVGPFIAAGALGAALTGAAIGAGVGAVAGALVGLGIPKEEAEWYEGEVKSGRTLVTVNAGTRYNEAREILREYGAYDIEDRDTDRYSSTYGTAAYAGSSRWEDASPRYRSRWQERYGTNGRRWEDDEYGYRYGWEMRNRQEYRDRPWNEVEPEFRQDWQSRHPDRPWDKVGDSIREAWEDITDRDDDRFKGLDTDERTIRLREEELRARKERERTVTMGVDTRS